MEKRDEKWWDDRYHYLKKRYKVKTNYELLKCLTDDLEKEHGQWNNIYKNGCSDPTWCDGVNLNLVRNHIIYYHEAILDLCNMQNLKCPDISVEDIPAEVPSNYMANLNPTDERQKKRLERLRPDLFAVQGADDFKDLSGINVHAEQLTLFALCNTMV